MTHPVISVIIPVKDRHELIEQTLVSVRGQTLRDWEAVVVDDGSTDGTIEAIEARAADDARIRLIRREGQRSGAPVCRNIGARAARGRHLVFLDSDDLLAETALERRVAFMDARPGLDFAVFGLRVFREAPGDTAWVMNRATGEDDLERFLRLDYPWQTTCPIWRREAFERVGGWDEALVAGQDLDLSARALALGLRYERAGECDVWYRAGGDGRAMVSRGLWSPGKLPSHERRLGKLRDLLVEQGGLTEVRRRLLAGNWFWIAQKWAKAGEAGEARRAWGEARRRGLVGRRRHVAGRVLLGVHGSRVAPLVMHRLCRTWPAEMFVGNRRTVCRTLPEDPCEPVAVPFEKLHPDRGAYHEVLRDGPWRYVARRLVPRRVVRAVRLAR